MGFYGLLLGVILLFTVALVSNVSQRASMLIGVSNNFNSYYNIQKVEMFRNIIESTSVQSNSTGYGDWLNSLYISANIDGINMSASNRTILINTKSTPKAYALVQVG